MKILEYRIVVVDLAIYVMISWNTPNIRLSASNQIAEILQPFFRYFVLFLLASQCNFSADKYPTNRANLFPLFLYFTHQLVPKVFVEVIVIHPLLVEGDV